MKAEDARWKRDGWIRGKKGPRNRLIGAQENFISRKRKTWGIVKLLRRTQPYGKHGPKHEGRVGCENDKGGKNNEGKKLKSVPFGVCEVQPKGSNQNGHGTRGGDPKRRDDVAKKGVHKKWMRWDWIKGTR